MGMSAAIRCGCARCRLHRVMLPAVLITLGLLLLIGEYGHYTLGRTWPILLIVIGAVKVAQSLASGAGHLAS